MKYFQSTIDRVNINSVRCTLYDEISLDEYNNRENFKVMEPVKGHNVAGFYSGWQRRPCKNVSLKIYSGAIHDKLLSIKENTVITVRNGILMDVHECKRKQ